MQKEIKVRPNYSSAQFFILVLHHESNCGSGTLLLFMCCLKISRVRVSPSGSSGNTPYWIIATKRHATRNDCLSKYPTFFKSDSAHIFFRISRLNPDLLKNLTASLPLILPLPFAVSNFERFFVEMHLDGVGLPVLYR